MHKHTSFFLQTYIDRNSSVGKAVGSQSVGCGFDAWPGRSGGSSPEFISVPTLIWCPFHPRVTTVASKRPQLFCQKCRWQVTFTHTYTLDPMKSVGWLSCPGTVWELSRKRSCMQLIRKRLSTVISAHWALVDWSWLTVELVPVSWSQLTKTNKKTQAGTSLFNFSPKILPCEEKATMNLQLHARSRTEEKHHI